MMPRVLVIGGHGTFGTHVCRELVKRGTTVTVAGRDLNRAAAFAHELGSNSRSLSLDVKQFEACRAALQGHEVVVNCAGPFSCLDAMLLEACLATGCHYADITDDRRYAHLVRSHDDRFRAAGLTAVYGCSSLPGISGALALLARDGTTTAVRRARVTLFIGNRNPKGSAAIQSLLAGLGRPIQTPQGPVRGFRDREVVPLPPPFGRRAVFNFESPEYDLLPALLRTGKVSVKAGFELRLATNLFALLALFGSGYGPTVARLLSISSRWLQAIGCSGGAVMTELFLTDNSVRRATLLARRDGQRMAALPAALVARALCGDGRRVHGSMTAYDFLGAATLLAEMTAAGYEVIHVDGA